MAPPGLRLQARPAPCPPKEGYKFTALSAAAVHAFSGLQWSCLEGPATSQRKSHRHHLTMAEGESQGQRCHHSGALRLAIPPWSQWSCLGNGGGEVNTWPGVQSLSPPVWEQKEGWAG